VYLKQFGRPNAVWRLRVKDFIAVATKARAGQPFFE
jgi:hypothetical protein